MALILWTLKPEKPYPDLTKNILETKQKIGHETRYTITPQNITHNKPLTFKIHIESNEHPENHTDPLKERTLLTINHNDTLTPTSFTKLSQDNYHIKGIMTFEQTEKNLPIHTLTLLIFDHEEQSFKWEINE